MRLIIEKRKNIIDGTKETKTKNLNLKNIFADIDFFSTDGEGKNYIRFDARTIEQLFKDTNYNLKIVNDNFLPKFLITNREKYKDWFDNLDD